MSSHLKLCVRFLLIALVGLATTTAVAAAGDEVVGRVTDVTLYRGQAMVTRAIPLAGPVGSVEIVVGSLPEQIVSDSLFAEGSEGTEVRAVRYRTRAVGETPREEVRKLDEIVEQVNDSLAQSKSQAQLLAKQTAYLDQLEGFVAPTAKVELSKGVLNAESLKAITEFSFEQRKAIAENQLVLTQTDRDLNEQLSLLQRKRAELTDGSSKTVREAVLFLEKHAEGEQTVRLTYQVSNCGWSPTYTFRAGDDLKKVDVECSALINQITGEEWNGVTLTLSTASPALSAAGPGLASFPVTLTQAAAQAKLTQRDLTSQIQSIRGRQSVAIQNNLNSLNLSDNIGSSWAANAAANEYQNLEILNGKEVLGMLRMESARAVEGPSLSYQLPGTVSLASRSDQQMVRILQTAFESHFYHVATPVLTSFVYREAELKNLSEKDLLAGPITVYLNNRFVGRSEIPTVARGQTFVVGFGADPQLRARRELADRKEAIQGGNRELSFKYRLVVENYKTEVVPVRIFDRMPHSDQSTDVRIALGELKDPLSEDEVYVRTEKSKGILRWEIDIPAAATGKDARIVEYGFTVDFDRNFALSAVGVGGGGDDPAAPAALQEDFEMMQRSRLKR
ncbi:MAG: mucoidy inhibitor MuiA family protein [Candidatus Nealsonbacteria bacterium]|nr:mucoidy inhibitor MuiA family protein [Candidatus Nealsonbacteria bacterium]